MTTEIAAGLRRAAKEMHGIVVSAGLMDKTVKVRLGGQSAPQYPMGWGSLIDSFNLDPTSTAMNYIIYNHGGIANPLPGKQWFKAPRYKLVHDPANSLRQGDVVAITPSWRESQHVRHVVKHIIAPYGPAIEERPAVPTMEGRAADLVAKRAAKDERRALNRWIGDGAAVAADADKLARETERVLARAGALPSSI
ncbi:hypothetical protein E0Z10_g8525 [Xylaria hypoxylon]|uniref:Uncharacterized protein n=1 Tax=Xylaria hypoxylon TaxID=37992 RepID=A0A4Z0YLC3_9PEZI|nr:hypothetical protein E0Z10_g8525 [Xylaria hypoxylon]